MFNRVIVTGGAGFLGTHLRSLLHHRGIEVVGVDLVRGRGPGLQLQGSVTSEAFWNGLPVVDGVIHAAAVSELWSADRNLHEQVNVGGTFQALRYAERVGARLVYVSSYTAGVPSGIIAETVIEDAAAPMLEALVGPYARSKRAAEMLCEQAAVEHVTVRPSALIGPGDFALTAPMRMVRDLVQKKLPAVMRGRMNVVDVRDVAAATIEALHKGEAGEKYLLSGYDLSIDAFARAVAEEADVQAPSMQVSPEVARLAARFSELIARLTGGHPSASIDGVEIASLPIQFEALRARSDLDFALRDLDDTLADAVRFIHQELLPG